MAEQRVAGGGADGGADGGEPQQGGGMSMMLRVLLVWTVGNMLFRQRQPQKQGLAASDAALAAADGQPPPRRQHRPIWVDGAKFDLRVIVSERAERPAATGSSSSSSSSVGGGGGGGGGGWPAADVLHEWREHDLFFDWRDGNSRNASARVGVTAGMLSNRSVWAHITATLDGYAHDPGAPHYDASKTLYRRAALTEHRAAPVVKKVRKLLGGGGGGGGGEAAGAAGDGGGSATAAATEVAAAAAAAGGGSSSPPPSPPSTKPVLFWKPALSVQLVHDLSSYPPGAIPPQLQAALQFDAAGDYFPGLDVDSFWLMEKDHVAVNRTALGHPGASVELRLSYSTLGMWKWLMQVQMAAQWKQQSAMGMQTSAGHDELKRMMLETDPLLLGVTMAVSALHTVFDFLAFKNDVQFWRKNKSLEGLSVRSIALNCFFQLVILAYLFDNDTSVMILASSSVGLLIELWKLRKAVRVRWVGVGGGAAWWAPWRGVRAEAAQTYARSRTAGHDKVATDHLLYVIAPLVVGYSTYSLVHNSHRSWTSWFLGSLTGFIYAFGFVMMTPQLYINYKLKSVAHLPWRAMVYKSLNTFVDDLFAFVIKMPTLHRIACFRDDLIFFVYLYQRWAYRTDYKRTNEFGQGGEEEGGEQQQQQGELTTTPAAAPAAIEGGQSQDQGAVTRPAAAADTLRSRGKRERTTTTA